MLPSMDTDALPDNLWRYVRTLLPDDLDTSARASGALVRRRGIRDAEALVRMLLAYGLTRERGRDRSSVLPRSCASASPSASGLSRAESSLSYGLL